MSGGGEGALPRAWPERQMQLQSAGLVGRAVAVHQRGQAGQAGQHAHAYGSLGALQPGAKIRIIRRC